MAKMTQAQTVAALAESQGVSKKDAKAFLESLAGLAVAQTQKAGEFTVPGIGKLVKSARKARWGRNPATGEKIKIQARTVVKFRVAKAAKDSIL
jgi:DNA-binding protein HU-beta